MSDPVAVWRLIERADERIKYAQNRDAAAAYAQARESLAEASALLDQVADERARAGLAAQIDRRLTDLEALEGAG